MFNYHLTSSFNSHQVASPKGIATFFNGHQIASTKEMATFPNLVLAPGQFLRLVVLAVVLRSL